MAERINHDHAQIVPLHVEFAQFGERRKRKDGDVIALEHYVFGIDREIAWDVRALLVGTVYGHVVPHRQLSTCTPRGTYF